MRTRIAFISLGFIAASALAWLYMHTSRTAEAHSSDVAAVTSPVAPNEKKERKPQFPETHGGRSSRIPPERFSQFLIRFQDWDSSPDSNRLMQEAARICEDSSSPRPAQNSSKLYVRHWLEGFCGNRVKFNADQYLERDPASKLMSQLYDAKGQPIKENRAAALEALRSSTSPSDLILASNYLSSSKERWNLGEELVKGSALDARLPTLQREAVASFACSYSGECGSDQLLSIARCDQFDLCQPGISFSDVEEMIYSPSEFRVITSIKQQLESQRRR